MEIKMILLAIIMIILYLRFLPKLDLFKTNGKWKLLLWYNNYDIFDNLKRSYIKLFEI